MTCRPSPHWLGALSVAFVGLVLDLGSKSLIFYVLGEPPQSEPVEVIRGFIYLTTSYNRGALWGLGHSFRFAAYFFGVISVLAAIAILWWLLCRGEHLGRWPAISLGLILAGALGNGFDRFVHGHVRDFIDVKLIVYDWPVFNLADTFLCIGAAMLAIYALLWAEEAPEPQENRSTGTQRTPGALRNP